MTLTNIRVILANRCVLTLEESNKYQQDQLLVTQKESDKFIDGTSRQRDKTRYMFKGNVYLKNKLVLAVLQDYVENNPHIRCNELKSMFDKSLQGSIGVVENEAIANRRKDYQVSFLQKTMKFYVCAMEIC